MNEGRKIRWYEVMYVVVLVVLLAWSVFFMRPHKVAVVDLDRVFKDVGMREKIEKDRVKLESYTKGVNLLNAYKARRKTLEDKLGAASTQAEKDRVSAQLKASDEQFSQTMAPHQGALQQYESAAVASFRKRVQPFIDQAALKRGVEVVVANGPQVLWYRNKVELTDDVVKAAKDFFTKDMPVIDPALGGKSPRR